MVTKRTNEHKIFSKAYNATKISDKNLRCNLCVVVNSVNFVLQNNASETGLSRNILFTDHLAK